MRYLGILATLAFTLAGTAEARQVQLQTSQPPNVGTSTSVFSKDGRFLQACSGCGCRGGAGYRLSNGKCAPRGG